MPGPGAKPIERELRWGPGGYAMGQVRYRFENGLGIGLTTKYYSIKTSGYGFFQRARPQVVGSMAGRDVYHQLQLRQKLNPTKRAGNGLALFDVFSFYASDIVA